MARGLSTTVLTMGLLAVALGPPEPLRAQSDTGISMPRSSVEASEARVRHISRVSRQEAQANPNLPIVVQGRVIGVDRDVSLPYTNIFIEDSPYGTMALSDGRFWLRGLPPGTHTLKARYISYAEGSATFTVRPGDILEVDFFLDIDPVQLAALDVRAERKLLSIQETGTARRLSGDEIDALPMDNVVEMVALQPGVVLEDNEIHIRGGRADDTQFLLDGIGVNDPLAAGRYGVNVNEDLINEIEVLTGGFSAEYGQAVSGVVNVSTKDGGDEFEGKVTWKTDQWAPEENDYNTDNMRLTLSGPNLLWDGLKGMGLDLPGTQSFIFSASGNLSDTHLPSESLTDNLQSPVLGDDWWSPRVQNEWSALGKLTWRFDPTRKLNLLYSNQQDVSLGYFLASEGFPRKYQNILDDYNVFTSQNIVSQATWRHVLGDETFYEISLGRQFSRLHSNKNGNDDYSTYVGPRPNLIPVRTGEDGILDVAAGAHVGGDADRWHDHYSEAWTIKGDYAWIANEANHFKAGFEYNYSEIQLVDLQGNLGSPSGALARSTDIFFAHPHVAAAYVQDRLDYNGLVLNAGLRLDAWAPGKEVDDVMSRPEDFIFIFDELAQSYQDKTYGVFGRRWKARISPRLGVSFPISPRDKFFFNYGHFNQWPRYNYVYAQFQTDFSTQLRLLGNPNLDPKVTVQYETGIQHQFDDLWSAGVTFYSNDIYGYAQAVGLDPVTIDPEDTPDPNDEVAQTISPIRYFNSDAARSLGVEVFLEKRATRWLSARASFELQQSTGTNSRADQTFLSAQLGEANSNFEREEGIRSTPLLWDRPWSVTLNVDFFVDEGEAPEPLGWTMPDQWSANLLFRAWAGARYTERILTDDGLATDTRDRYGELGPYRSSLDLKLRKWWDLPFGRRFTLFFEGRNLLDHANYRRVNPWTGEGYHVGNWDGDIAAGTTRTVYSKEYAEDYVDPSYRTDPRMVLMGASWEW